MDYQYAQSLDWGRGRGCGFVYSNCRNWLQNARSQYVVWGLVWSGTDAPPPRDLYPYCTDSDWHGNHHRCVNSWKAVGDCGIKNYTNPLRYKVCIVYTHIYHSSYTLTTHYAHTILSLLPTTGSSSKSWWYRSLYRLLSNVPSKMSSGGYPRIS